MSIAENLRAVKQGIPDGVTVVAISKTKADDAILQAFNTGHLDFGENKVQEMTGKWERLPKTIRWHMVGHVQRNKVKYMAPFVSLVHGVDSFRLLKEIDKQGRKYKRIIPCLLQIHIAEEDTKFGFDPEEAMSVIKSPEFRALTNIDIKGLMGMATFTEDRALIRKEFKGLKVLFDRIAEVQEGISILSMGMSNDYGIAIEEGANMVRIGSRIFGPRN